VYGAVRAGDDGDDVRKDHSIRCERQCKHCATTFLSIKRRGKWPEFCSRSCFLASTKSKQDEVTCEGCGARFKPAKAATKYCSEACSVRGRYGPPKQKQCEHCGSEFATRRGEQKFCSDACYLGSRKRQDYPPTKSKECPVCDSVFEAEQSSFNEDGYAKYCSPACHSEGKRTGREVACANCGSVFYASPSKEDRGARCCSRMCRDEWNRGSNSRLWVGAYTDGATGKRLLNAPRPGFVSPYIGEHRIVAAKAIGRLLDPHECVLHLNNNLADNRPENLFVCGSVSEMIKRVSGTLPWPAAGNLDTYEKGAPLEFPQPLSETG
jgi:hypothetical protein